MRIISFCAIACLVAGIVNAAPPVRFSGRWVAAFKGTDICIIEIEESDGKVSGESKACKISVDQNGDLLEGESPDPSQAPEPFLSPKVDGASLRYEQADGADRMKFEFRVTGEGKAELRFVGAPIAIKPIRFERR